MMKPLLGLASANRAKEAAVRLAFRRLRVPYRLVTVPVDSRVSSQPRTEQETILGASNRAQALLERTRVDLAIAFEGGVDRNLWGTFTCEWCVVLDRFGSRGIGGGAQLLLPPDVADALAAGEDLGAITDRLTNRTGTGSAEGILGILTRGRVSRSEAHAQILTLALARYLSAPFYENRSAPTSTIVSALLVERLGTRRPEHCEKPTQLELRLH